MGPEAQIDAARTVPDAGGDALAALGMAPALRQTIARALSRPTGLLVLTGIGAEEAAAAICAQSHAALHGAIDDAITVGEAIEAAERRFLIAIAEGADAIATLLGLRRVAADRFALAATLRLVIAARRADRLCPGCRCPEQAFGSMSALLGLDPGSILWTADGCSLCAESGRDGSVGVFEGVEIDAPMRRLIYDGADAPLLARHAFLSAPNFASAARTLAREGVIAPEDAVRVSRNDLALRERPR
jgi:type II secretory ATPase GspE/PulE/Tfp pilus assembly ATPase PilB-like protein